MYDRKEASYDQGQFVRGGLIGRRSSIDPLLTLYGHIETAEQRTIIQQYGDWYTGR